MKEQMLKIAKDLEQGTITETEAQNLLLGLFGVSNRRELLISYSLYNVSYKNAQHSIKGIESSVDSYLRNL